MRGSWRLNRTATYWPSLLWPSAFLSRSPGLLNRGLGPSLSGCWFSLPHLISNWSGLQTDWISCALSYIINSSTPTFLLWVSQIALIQLIHGQGYNILNDRMHLLFTQVHFLFWQPGRVVGQYTTKTRQINSTANLIWKKKKSKKERQIKR